MAAASTPYEWAAARCAQREMCRADVVQKLRLRDVSPAEAERIADRLEAEGFISAERYARAFTHDKFAYDHWGRIKISQALRMKGIHAGTISEALAQIDPEAYAETLQTLLQQKARTLRAASTREKRTKLLRFAASRGFESHLTLDLLPEADEDEEWP